MLDMHIFLIGMPGSGKSSLGKRVAHAMGLPYVDMDSAITEAFGCPVTEIFARWGEDAFRCAETNLLIRLYGAEPSIVSTGGGTVLRETNRALMRNMGLIVLVDRPLDQIMGDIKLDRRPLLAQKGLPEVERRYQERIGMYRAAADAVLRNDGGYYSGLEEMQRLLRWRFVL